MKKREINPISKSICKLRNINRTLLKLIFVHLKISITFKNKANQKITDYVLAC